MLSQGRSDTPGRPPFGNPQARSLFEMVAYLQKAEGTVLKIRASDAG